MRVCLTYIFPQLNLPVYQPAARRFAESYMQNPPGLADHEIHVFLNAGTGPGPIQERTFSPLPVKFHDYSNWGKDIGAFQHAADTIDCDLLVCMGSFVHFPQPSWLDLIVRSYEDYGPGVYGAFAFHQPMPHIRTTIFWLPPMLLQAYPHQVGDQNRYGFEHGPESITLWSRSKRFEPRMVTRRGVFEMNEWHHVEARDCLCYDQHTEKIGYR